MCIYIHNSYVRYQEGGTKAGRTLQICCTGDGWAASEESFMTMTVGTNDDDDDDDDDVVANG